MKFNYQVLNDTDCMVTGSDIIIHKKLTIPPIIDGYKVTRIGDNAFRDNHITSLKGLPEGLIHIGRSAFRGNKITSLEGLPEGLKRIDVNAFRDNHITSLDGLPESMHISKGVFCDNHISSLKGLPEGLTRIGQWAFSHNHITSLEGLPKGLTHIGVGTFRFNTITSLEGLPKGLTHIGDDAFSNNKITSLEGLPKGLTHIEGYAFVNNDIRIACIPDSVNTLGIDIFHNNNDLTSITYKDKSTDVRCIDGYIMCIVSTKKIKDTVIHKARHWNTETKCYIANKDKYYAHGESVKEAMSDIHYKMNERDIDSTVDKIRNTGLVSPEEYRVITGACKEGTRKFLQDNNLEWDSAIKLSKALELVRGSYGYEAFVEAVTQ